MSVPTESMTVIDTPLLQVPFEALKRSAKDRKQLIDDTAETVGSLMQAQHFTDKEKQIAHLDQLVSQLQGLKRKIADVASSECSEAQRCKARLQHLQTCGTPPSTGVTAWNKPRLDRILVDHLLRSGFQDAAYDLSVQSNCTQLVDIHIFWGAQRVIDALRKQDCGAALEWCTTNSARLKKIKSKLEFKLRLQEYIELVRQEKRLDAIAYARQHLSQWASLYMPELQRAVASVAFPRSTQCTVYAALFEESQWEGLVDVFKRDLFRLHCLTPESLLAIHLQAGLSALKTLQSYQPGCSKEDPLHMPSFQKLAEGLPYAKHVRSKLICSITRQIMNESNPPIVLPNGYVYSERGTEKVMAANQGKLVCPHTGEVFSKEELRRAFVV